LKFEQKQLDGSQAVKKMPKQRAAQKTLVSENNKKKK